MIRTRPLLILLVLAAVVATACSLLREPEEASGPIEAIPLELETETPAQVTATLDADTSGQNADDGYPPPAQVTDQEEDPTGYPAAFEDDVPDAAYPPAEETVEGGVAETSEAGELLVYQIRQEASQVTFELDEDLRGVRTTVVGRTDQVAGEIALNMADLSTARLGVIQINARTLATDNNFRNRAIQNQILETGAYEFITFTPTAIIGLPASVSVGDEVAFTVEGDLTIRDITQPVSFDVAAAVVSETELSGRATTSIDRADFDLRIPQVRDVANVEEVVELAIAFVARAS